MIRKRKEKKKRKKEKNLRVPDHDSAVGSRRPDGILAMNTVQLHDARKSSQPSHELDITSLMFPHKNDQSETKKEKEKE